jgi:cysteine-rich repeat protein
VKRALITITLIVLSACGDNAATVPEPICGDGVVDGNEACDDGNDVDTDQCSNACKVPGCGDGVVNFNEACDDGNGIDGDGCDTNCTQSFCGNGIKGADEDCDDGNTVSGDGCDANCKASGCGNGVMSVGEACDDGNMTSGDGCDANCTVSACGNNIVAATEQCDDGNTMSADGCSATCAIETLEVEPNDDGTVATGAAGITGNDFATAAPDANGQITANATIIGALTPAGDEDIFKLRNAGTTPALVTLDTWNLSAGFGIGVSCGTASIDTGVQVRNAAGTVLASNDNRTTSDRCSNLRFALAPNEIVYVQVVEVGDNAVVPSYALNVVFTPSVCGDGMVGVSEQCDDMNTAAGDGCSATCAIEGAVTEIEPNEDGTPSMGGTGITGNDFGTVNPLNNGLIANNVTVIGAISPTGDEDVFAFTNPRLSAVVVTFDVWSLTFGHGVGVPCDATVDTGFVIRDAAGTSLATNDDRVLNDNCSKLSFSLFPGETRFLQLTEFGDNAVISSYALVVKYVDVVCGDGTIGLGEQCDDSNTTSGDGCSSSCQIEPFCGDSILQPAEWCDDGNMTAGDGCSSTCQVENAVIEIEPNEDGTPSIGGSGTVGNDFATTAADANGAFTTSTRIAARMAVVGDEDVFAFTNPGAEYVIAQFDIWNNAPGFGIGVPCGTAIDTGLHIRDAAGLSLASNDDRNGATDRCSTLSFAIAPGQTVYAHAVEFGDNAIIASYTLIVVYAPVPCGDSVMGLGEQCDDGNTANGDGCSSTCRLENAANEIEPNDDGTVNTAAAGITGNDFSSVNANGPFAGSKRIIAKLGVSGDEDVIAFTNPSTGSALLRFDVWNLAPGTGIGVPCGTAIDTGLNIKNAAGTVLASNDDRNGSADRCSGLSFLLSGGQTVYAQVVESGDNAVIAGYVLDVAYTLVICGDTVVGPNEQCDDGNTVNGDGCSSTCQFEVVCGNGVLQATEQCDDANLTNGDGCSSTCTIENLVTEVEPNNTQTDASTNALQLAGNTVVAGAIGTVGDVDRYQLTVAAARTVRFETFTSWGDCSTATLDLQLFDSVGAVVVNDLAGSGIAQCGAISIFLAAGTYQVQVEERGNNATVAAYLLQVALPNDAGMETEPNDATTTANVLAVSDTYVFGDHTMTADADVYRITVPAGARIRAEVIEGNRQMETCESGGVDTRLTLFDAAGTQLVDDGDDGRGLCSMIDGTGSTPLDAVARNTSSTPKTFFVMVRASNFASGTSAQFVYRLQVTLR